ncbi:hypothetical protein HHK36_028572 [Tetracentron sinense]|uniref:Vesicle transport protein GOT1B n=1 Tax=Tetracentron sinense TaxID=13715 RepID=A0A834YCP7_TETSI|nr:hypothetical protein HHK36_028572 [Tetracentron sinense]
MGNILFLSGVMLTIGLKSTMQFFMKRQNYKGTISFGTGFFLVLIGWPIMGMILEAYGFIVLFSGFWPTLAVFLQRIPILGWVFQQPFVTSFFDRYRGKRVPGYVDCFSFLAVQCGHMLPNLEFWTVTVGNHLRWLWS